MCLTYGYENGHNLSNNRLKQLWSYTMDLKAILITLATVIVAIKLANKLPG